MTRDGSSSDRTPIQLGYAMTARPSWPAWLTIVRAAGVAAGSVVGAVGGWGFAFAIAIALDHVAQTTHPAWLPKRTLGEMEAVVFLLGVLCGASAGGAWALKLCRKYPQWTRH